MALVRVATVAFIRVWQGSGSGGRADVADYAGARSNKLGPARSGSTDAVFARKFRLALA